MDADDAYAITIAIQEQMQVAHNPCHRPGYVLSNDLFQDA